MRSTPGSSFGPMAISATTAMTTSSLHPMSNMENSAHAKFAPFPVKQDWAPARVCLPAFASDSFAADVRSRRRRGRGVVIDRLDRLGLVGGLFVVLLALFEGLVAFPAVPPHLRTPPPPTPPPAPPPHP